MGLPKQIGLVGNNFSNTSSALFIAYLIAEMPNGKLQRKFHLVPFGSVVPTKRPGLILQQISAPKWLGINVILWGIATGCTAAAYSYHTLLVARIFLGVFEAALSPSLTLISSQWYTKSEQAPRFSVWFIGVGLGQITGGIVSYAFQHVKHETIAGWQIMFVILGLVTVIVGIATIFIIPDTPMDARFLSDAEKLALLHHVSINRTGIQNKNFKFSQLLEILVDPQMWLLTILTILVWLLLSSVLNRSGIDVMFMADCDLKRSYHNILGDVNTELRLFIAYRSSPEYPLRACLYHVCSWDRLRNPSYLESMGLDCSLLRARHNRRRVDVISSSAQPWRSSCRHLYGQRDHCHARHYIPVDGIQCCWADETSRKRGLDRWQFQRRQHYRTADVPGEGCPPVYPCQDNRSDFSSRRCIFCYNTLCLLFVGQ